MATTKVATAPMKAAQVPKPKSPELSMNWAPVSPHGRSDNAPLEKAAEGYARMMSGKAHFRVVLTM